MSGEGEIEEVGRVTKRKKRGLADMLWEEREAADEESDLLSWLDVRIIVSDNVTVMAHKAMLAFRFPPFAQAFKPVPAEEDVTLIATEFDREEILADLRQLYFCQERTLDPKGTHWLRHLASSDGGNGGRPCTLSQRKTKPTSGGGGDTLDEIREALVDPSELMETQVSGDGSHVSSKEGRNSSLAGDFVDVDASETGSGVDAICSYSPCDDVVTESELLDKGDSFLRSHATLHGIRMKSLLPVPPGHSLQSALVKAIAAHYVTCHGIELVNDTEHEINPYSESNRPTALTPRAPKKHKLSPPSGGSSGGPKVQRLEGGSLGMNSSPPNLPHPFGHLPKSKVISKMQLIGVHEEVQMGQPCQYVTGGGVSMGGCNREILNVTHESQLASKGTSFLRAHAAQHEIKNSSRMKKADVVRLLAEHYSTAHNHHVEEDMDGAGTQPPNPKFANSASYHLAQAAAASAAGTSYGGLHEAAPGVALPTHPVTVPVVQNEDGEFELLEENSVVNPDPSPQTAAVVGVEGYEDMSYEPAAANHLVIHDSGVSADLPQLPDPAALAAAELQEPKRRGYHPNSNTRAARPEEARICPVCELPVHKRSIKRHMMTQHNLEKHEVDQLLKSQIYGNYDLTQSESMNSSNLNDSHEEEFGSHFLAMPQETPPEPEQVIRVKKEVVRVKKEPAFETFTNVTPKHKCPVCTNEVMANFLERHLSVMHVLSRQERARILAGFGIEPSSTPSPSKEHTTVKTESGESGVSPKAKSVKKIQCPHCSNLVVSKYVERHMQIIHKMNPQEISETLQQIADLQSVA